jgi:NAD(P)-dependent dehydrogenase (short-subunit alcohol dehydrogenase family)
MNLEGKMKGEIRMDLLDKVVVVTGAANGIGKAVAAGYAEHGATVVMADVDEKEGEKAAQHLIEKNRRAKFVRTDVRREEDIINLMKMVRETYGRIDTLINNAGKGLFKPVYDLTLEEWDDIIQTNLSSVFLCSREAAKVMRENGGGSIVNLASTRALMSEPNSEGYAASKGGIVAITHALAASLGEDRITVNCISPGWIYTGDYAQLTKSDHEQHFSKRVGKPSDITQACLYLTAKENNFVTGINLIVDGGMTRKMLYEE